MLSVGLFCCQVRKLVLVIARLDLVCGSLCTMPSLWLQEPTHNLQYCQLGLIWLTLGYMMINELNHSASLVVYCLVNAL